MNNLRKKNLNFKYKNFEFKIIYKYLNVKINKEKLQNPA